MSNLEYKQYHESFMQNNNGTSALDTFSSIIPNFFTTCVARYVIINLGVQKDYIKVLIEFILIIVPVILSTTIFVELRLLWLILSLIIFCLLHMNSFDLEILKLKVDRRRKWHCISYVRSLVNLITAFCILGVDFNIFPRYFAKTEKYGYSLMDLGVGLFVFANALVPSKVSRHSLPKSLELNFKPCIVLFLLGLSRCILVTEMDYHEHVTEYGVHWNFFITLSVTKVVAITILCIFKETNALICGVSLLCLHELILNNGISDWVFSDIIRRNFISSNREGISSCLGYVALYLISTYIGLVIRDKYKENTESVVIKSLFLIISVSWLSVYITNAYLDVSRCLANAGYCCYILAVGTTILTLFFIFELCEISSNKNPKKAREKTSVYSFPIIFNAINNNGLLFFIIANILTGLVNISIETFYLGPFKSLIVLFLYMILLILLVVGIQIRFPSNLSLS